MSSVAPEVSTHSYDERVDIYSLGLLIYFLISKGQYKAQDSEENKDIFVCAPFLVRSLENELHFEK